MLQSFCDDEPQYPASFGSPDPNIQLDGIRHFDWPPVSTPSNDMSISPPTSTARIVAVWWLMQQQAIFKTRTKAKTITTKAAHAPSDP